MARMPASMTRLSRWLLLGEWRAHPVRTLVAIAAIAVGISLGFAIHLINAAAFNEFSAAIKGLSGVADIQVSGTEAFFDEAIYPQLAQRQGVAVASPVLEFDASVPGQRTALKIIGIDAFRAGFIAPDLIGIPADGNINDTLADDALFLSPAAQQWFKVAAGGSVDLQAGVEVLRLRVAGALQRARPGQRLGVMDIGAAQWRFHKLGQLSRIDLKLRDGVNRDAFKTRLAQDLERRYPGRFRVNQPSDEEQNSRNQGMSRAYRVNLTVLALVALFTGAFLVFSTQALSVVRRRSQFALLRVLGLDRRALLRQILLEGLSLGIAGSAIGIAAGYGLAAAALHFFGGDLGAGFFSGVRPEVQFAPVAAAIYFALGVGVAVLGCAAPAFEAARARPAVALKSGTEEGAMARLSRPWPAVACLLLAALLTQAPPVFELPLFGYLSIALLLLGATAGLRPEQQAAITSLPGVASADFLRVRSLSLAPDRPNVALMARSVDAAHPDKTLAIVGAMATPTPGGPPPAWISEAMVDLYGMAVGQRVQLPLAGKMHEFLVAGVWRDYARPTGSVQIRLSDYRAITGDGDASNVALWMQPGASASDVEKRLKQLPFGATLETSAPSDIRAMSMKVFDRSFAITYLLEAIAIVIGLFGVAATFSAQTLARSREFGMLRHVGVTRSQILSILAIEGGSLTALGIATGFVLGWIISLILVFIVNPQSFHWTMQLHMPWPLLATVAALLLGAAALTALLAGRQALSGGPIRAVREDW